MMMVVSIISLSFLLSDLSFAKKKNKQQQQQQGPIQTSVKAAEDITDSTIKGTVDILKSL